LEYRRGDSALDAWTSKEAQHPDSATSALLAAVQISC
jgi:hypothetical protein